MAERKYEADVVIVGAGLAGLTTAHELLERGKSVLLIDRDGPEKLGGLAKESSGGIHLIDTPHQRRRGIEDGPDLAFADWCRYSDFGPADEWPRAWARFYCDHSHEILDFLHEKGIAFLPVVNWAERGLDTPGNSVPRWHIAWGTGWEIVDKVTSALDAHSRRDKLQILFDHDVEGIDLGAQAATGVHGISTKNGPEFTARAECVVIASGGMCGGDLRKVRENWYPAWGEPPELILNGGHRFADGKLHDRARELGANVTHLQRQWHYPSGVHLPAQHRPHDGISLVPPRSALWVNALGERIRNPGPLTANTDTRHLVASICRQPGKYSWQVMNMKIAAKELSVSGVDYSTAIRYRRRALMAKHVLFGNRELIERLLREFSEDFVAADNVRSLVDKMNEKNLYGLETNPDILEREIDDYDGMIRRGVKYFNDDQLRRIMNFRTYAGDRLRTCKFQPILDDAALPLIAVREFIVTRKSMGGIQTDLRSRVLDTHGRAIGGLFAVGEAAGFGGGGLNGLRALEGTFLGACVLTGLAAGRSIAEAGS